MYSILLAEKTDLASTFHLVPVSEFLLPDSVTTSINFSDIRSIEL